ncbi:hypothetical protein EST38_g9639 [Candolleomyces aberdarensis]|uniref:Uncharacterized protein n=1 Tax=Candolleomyces aberdarensis TaxID=2316362 RepID=A0A4Q2D9H0_9AGAR|nr:hypothetical protein EST38_g9639 [Candolleomyces aberdarensis]
MPAILPPRPTPTTGPSNNLGGTWDMTSLQSFVKATPTVRSFTLFVLPPLVADRPFPVLQPFGIPSGVPSTLSASIVSHFSPANVNPTLMQNGLGLMLSTANGFSALPSLPSLPPPPKASRGANKENAVPGSHAALGSEKFCLPNYKNKKTGRARYAFVWAAVPGNKNLLTSDFNNAWHSLSKEEKEKYEAEAAALKAQPPQQT